ncbi:unnamed protein product [Macrosiphum euphorbiae]|uniref:Uncharacterized protein n=1 Tax=Macrosiphum euphorbiae TaxID=13131 RepID=A0AAV0VYP0_9HEMI|nr:unnamed protein product [Macrosiphum euphorbiae]
MLSSPTLSINTKCFLYKTNIRSIAYLGLQQFKQQLAQVRKAPIHLSPPNHWTTMVSEQQSASPLHWPSLIKDNLQSLTNSVKTKIQQSPHNYISDISNRTSITENYVNRQINF